VGQVELPWNTVSSQPQYSTRSSVQGRAEPQVQVLPQASEPWQSSPEAQSAAEVHALPLLAAGPGWGGGCGAGHAGRTASIAITMGGPESPPKPPGDSC
jgi:hypothetical protein